MAWVIGINLVTVVCTSSRSSDKPLITWCRTRWPGGPIWEFWSLMDFMTFPVLITDFYLVSYHRTHHHNFLIQFHALSLRSYNSEICFLNNTMNILTIHSILLRLNIFLYKLWSQKSIYLPHSLLLQSSAFVNCILSINRDLLRIPRHISEHSDQWVHGVIITELVPKQ